MCANFVSDLLWRCLQNALVWGIKLDRRLLMTRIKELTMLAQTLRPCRHSISVPRGLSLSLSFSPSLRPSVRQSFCLSLSLSLSLSLFVSLFTLSLSRASPQRPALTPNRPLDTTLLARAKPVCLGSLTLGKCYLKFQDSRMGTTRPQLYLQPKYNLATLKELTSGQSCGHE